MNTPECKWVIKMAQILAVVVGSLGAYKLLTDEPYSVSLVVAAVLVHFVCIVVVWRAHK